MVFILQEDNAENISDLSFYIWNHFISISKVFRVTFCKPIKESNELMNQLMNTLEIHPIFQVPHYFLLSITFRFQVNNFHCPNL